MENVTKKQSEIELVLEEMEAKTELKRVLQPATDYGIKHADAHSEIAKQKKIVADSFVGLKTELEKIMADLKEENSTLKGKQRINTAFEKLIYEVSILSIDGLSDATRKTIDLLKWYYLSNIYIPLADIDEKTLKDAKSLEPHYPKKVVEGFLREGSTKTYINAFKTLKEAHKVSHAKAKKVLSALTKGWLSDNDGKLIVSKKDFSLQNLDALMKHYTKYQYGLSGDKTVMLDKLLSYIDQQNKATSKKD